MIRRFIQSAVLIFLTLFAASSVLAAPKPTQKPTKTVAHKPVRKKVPPPPVRYIMPQGWPKRLLIGKIGVNASIESLAFDRVSDVHAPYKWGEVAWYNKGPKPGEVGRADIYGHLDSTCCPAVFYKLRDVKKNDVVSVLYKGNKLVRFKVMWTGIYANNKIPLKFIYQVTRERGLILITCTGVFHRSSIGYDHKLIVYARLLLPNGKIA